VQIQEDLSQRIKSLEKELEAALDEKEREFRYRWERGKAKFEEEILSQHRKLKLWLPSYIRQSRFLAVVTAPVLYLGFIPFFLLDLFCGGVSGHLLPGLRNSEGQAS